MTRADISPIIRHRHAGIAKVTVQQSAQQIARRPTLPGRIAPDRSLDARADRRALVTLARLHSLPQRLLDDPEALAS
jgi:hypothetical protein